MDYPRAGGNYFIGEKRHRFWKAMVKALEGDRKGQYSIRVNRQWRICFEWPEGQSGPGNVEIVDYHS